MRQKLTVALLCAIFGACSGSKPEAYVIPTPVFITPFNPPVEYERWYHQAERCAGMMGNYGAVQWGVVPTPWGKPGERTYAEWTITRDQRGFVTRAEIVVNAEMWRDSLLILHESLHDILWRNGWLPPDNAKLDRANVIMSAHPSPPFRTAVPLGICPAIFYPWPK